MGNSPPGARQRAAHANAGNPSKPLVKISTWKWASAISEKELALKRETFWAASPSYGGLEHTWEILKGICTNLIEDGDVANASAILQAVNITTPTGSLGLCYDSLGNKYELPRYCFATPSNVGQDQPAEMDEPPTDMPTHEVGMKFRRSYDTTATEVVLPALANDSIATVKSAYKAETKIPEEAVLRFFFRGREMLDDRYVCQYPHLSDKVVTLAHVMPSEK